MTLYDLNGIPRKEMIPGYHVILVHSDQMTVANWQIDQGAAMPEHSHPHEQILNLISGEFELNVEGMTHHLTDGNVFVIPGGVSHGGKALTPCKIIDVFYPVREDYRDLS